MKDKLTPLEAAMLGLWLMGMRWVATDRTEKDEITCTWAYEGEVVLRKGAYKSKHIDNAGHVVGCGQLIRAGYEVSDAPIEILPWLTAHGITPPEVEG